MNSTHTEHLRDVRRMWGRRLFIPLLAAFSAGPLHLGCASSGPPELSRVREGAKPSDEALGRLRARVTGPGRGGQAGLRPFVPGRARGGLLLVPASYRPERPAPLVVMLHGAGGQAQGGMHPFATYAESAGVILYAPDSQGPTWDFIRGPFAEDRASLDAALRRLFSEYNVDATRVWIEGFSDGASYALTIGLTNGDLFSRIAAFSPGMGAVLEAHGKPAVFISHGTLDDVLAIDRTSRQIVPRLQAQGYAVEYHEFDGRHAVPDSLARRAFTMMIAPP